MRGRSMKVVVFLTAIVMVTLAGVFALSGRSRREVSEPAPAGVVGREEGTAPDFTLPSFDGRKIMLRQLQGRPVVVNFWASWCGPCRAEAPNLERAWKIYRPKGVVFLGVNVADTEGDAREFLSTFKPSFLNVRDPTQHVLTAYRVSAIPTTFFIDREGHIRRRYVGAFVGETGLNRLSAWIEELVR